MITFLLVATYFLALFSVLELIARKVKLNIEVSRKLAHIIAGVSAAFLPLVMPFSSIIGIALLFLVVMLVSRRAKLFRSIHDVKRQSYGELLFPLGVALTAWLFPIAHIYTYAILIMSVSDGLAGLLGSKFGKMKYTLGSAHKSYIGSTVFLITALVIGFSFSWSYSIIAISLVLTLVEAASTRGVDNVLLPPVAALLLTAIV